MITPNNPAGRLFNIVEQAKQNKHALALPVMDGWSQLNGLTEAVAAKVIENFVHFLHLPDEIVHGMENIKDLDPEPYIAWYPKVYSHFARVNFGGALNEVFIVFDTNAMGLIKICGERLAMMKAEPVVSDSDLADLLEKVRQAIRKLNGVGLREDLVQYLLKHLLIVEQALVDYRVCGYPSLMAGFESVAGSIAVNMELARESQRTPAGKTAWDAIGKFAILVTAVGGTLHLVADVKGLLPTGSAKVPAELEAKSDGVLKSIEGSDLPSGCD